MSNLPIRLLTNRGLSDTKEVLERQQKLYNKGIITARELHDAVVEVMGRQALAKKTLDDWIERHILFPE